MDSGDKFTIFAAINLVLRQHICKFAVFLILGVLLGSPLLQSSKMIGMIRLPDEMKKWWNSI